MRTTLNITDFTFSFAGYGHCKVTYTSPATGKQWSKTTNNMPLIDSTNNADNPKKKDMQDLMRMCKS